MNEKIELRATAAPWHNGIEILLMQGRGFGTNIIVEEKPEGVIVEPTMRIDITAAQTLMDDLWQAGLRPTEGTGSAGSLRSTEKHLNDMRKIVAHKLNIELK